MRLPSLPVLVSVAVLLLVRPIRAADCLNIALSAIPSCAQPCYLEGAPTIGCDGLDFACQCGKQAAMFAAIEGCVASKCPADEVEGVIDGSEKVCACAAGTRGGTVASVSGSMTVAVPAPTGSSLVPAPASSIPAAVSGGGGGSGGSEVYPTRPVPTNYASATSVSGAEGRCRVGVAQMGVGVVAMVVVAVLGF